MSKVYSDDQLVLAARLYFLDGLPQAQIGRLVNVSQSKISRMLALARERGLVRISVPEYEPRASAVEQEVKRTLGLEAVVVRSVAGLRIKDLRQSVGYFAAPLASQWMDEAGIVAVAGGRTIRALVEYMKPLGHSRLMTCIQAMGNIDSSPGAYDAVELGRTLAHRWGANFLTLNTPAILPDEETCRSFLKLEQIHHVMVELAKADLAFVGIGSLANSVFAERNVFAPKDVEILREAGAVGEILGRFFDECGRECAASFQRRVVSLPLGELQRVARRVGVVAGADRTAAVLAAIRGGLVNALVMDEGSATVLLEVSR
jgi:DNA-binding transcriptional regulator LsrR (DeoR family)